MNLAFISLSQEGAALAFYLLKALPGGEVFLHRQVSSELPAKRFNSIMALTKEIFSRYEGLIYVMPVGVVIRSLAPHLRDKTQDPAVVAVDAGGRYAISLLSGHEGGANDLALVVGNILGAEPIITTTTEALKTMIVGIGCRRGVGAESIVTAVQTALEESAVGINQVRYLASADLKADEKGLIEAAKRLEIPLRFITSQEIRTTIKAFEHSEFVKEKVNLPAVAEASALLAGRRTQLILPKKNFNGVTIAIARENFLWSASVPEDR
ncbi:MAG: cobalamin biosynthesis protein [Pseudomonadota bacterium]